MDTECYYSTLEELRVRFLENLHNYETLVDMIGENLLTKSCVVQMQISTHKVNLLKIANFKVVERCLSQKNISVEDMMRLQLHIKELGNIVYMIAMA